MRKIDANLVPPLDIWAGKGYLLDIYQYTGRSVEKRVCRTFHLAFYLIQLAEGVGISARELVYW